MCQPKHQNSKWGGHHLSLWSILREHAMKGGVYAALSTHAATLALFRSSGSPLSYASHTAMALLGLWLLWGEIELILKRIRKRLPAGEIGIPIINDIRTLMIISDGHAAVRRAQEKRSRYGSVYVTSFLGRINVLLGGYNDISWLWTNDRKGNTDVAWPRNIELLLGPSAVPNQIGSYHRTLRRTLEPYFTPAFVRNYLPVMDETTCRELERWYAQGSKGETVGSGGGFVSSDVFKMYALRLFYMSSFGRVDEEMIERLHDDFKIWIGGFYSLTSRRIPGTKFDDAIKARDRMLRNIDALIDEFIKENPPESEKARSTFIGGLVYGKDKNGGHLLSRDEMKDNILSLIFAGHDTTYASISTLLYHLCTNPDAMSALIDEVSAFREPLDHDELRDAPILNACIYESWRMDPPVQGGFRTVRKGPVRWGEYTYDQGTVFNYSISSATSDPANYPRGTATFRMERFLPPDHPLYRPELISGVGDNVAGGNGGGEDGRSKSGRPIDPTRGTPAYPIFGGGTHVCMGKAFALLEMRVLAARMFKKYDVEVRNCRKVFLPMGGWKVDFRLTDRTSGEKVHKKKDD